MRGLWSAGTLFVLLFSPARLVAEVPRVLNHQGRLTDVNGRAVEGVHLMEFSLFSSQTGGSRIWPAAGLTERQNVTVRHGVFNVLLTFPPSVSFLDQYYLEIKVDSDPALPRTPLAVVPYAQATASVGVGSVDSAVLSSGSVTAAGLAPGSITTTQMADGAVLTRHVGVADAFGCSNPGKTGTTSFADVCNFSYQASRRTTALLVARVEAAAHTCGHGATGFIAMSSTFRVLDGAAEVFQATDGVTLNTELAVKSATNSIYWTRVVTLQPGSHTLTLSARFAAADCTEGAGVTWTGSSLALQPMGVVP